MENGLHKKPLFALAAAETDVSATLLEIVKPCYLDLIEEINRVLVFTASETHGVPVSRVCLLGSVAHWPGAQEDDDLASLRGDREFEAFLAEIRRRNGQ